MKKKINIEYLNEGDLVAIAFVAKHIDIEMCNFAIQYFKKEGLKVLVENNNILNVLRTTG